MATVTEPSGSTLIPLAADSHDSSAKAELQRLQSTDNFTNFFYLLRVYLFLALTIGGAVAFAEWQQREGFSVLWTVPVFLAAIVLVGAGQHQLSMWVHEAVHHTLFRNRLLNDLGADLMASYLMFSSVYQFRLQHLAHHRFLNDPDLDPEVAHLKASGLWDPASLKQNNLLVELVKRLNPLRLFRYALVRMTFKPIGHESTSSASVESPPSRVALRIGMAYILICVTCVLSSFFLHQSLLLTVVPAALWLTVCLVYWLLPANKFHKSHMQPILHIRYISMIRLGFITLLCTTLGGLSLWTGVFIPKYYGLLWLLPLFTSFSYFTIVRQMIQRQSGPRSWETGRCAWILTPLVRVAFLPLGQRHYLAHETHASVPHYRLKQLQRLLARQQGGE